MRRFAPLLAVLALATPAAADAKIQALTPGFVKEAKACAVEQRGLEKVVVGATERIARLGDAERPARAHSLEVVREGLAVVQMHCAAVDAYVAFLQANAAAKYRAVERELDEHDRRVRKLRRAAKDSMARTQPEVRALIALNAERPAAPTAPRTTPATFPSGRRIELPALPGAWKLSGTAATDTAEYSEPAQGLTATLTARAFTGATCDQQRDALARRSPELTDLESAAPIAWSVRAVRADKPPHLVSVMCMPTKTGGVLGTSDLRPASQTALADQLAPLMQAMLAAHGNQLEQLNPNPP